MTIRKEEPPCPEPSSRSRSPSPEVLAYTPSCLPNNGYVLPPRRRAVPHRPPPHTDATPDELDAMVEMYHLGQTLYRLRYRLQRLADGARVLEASLSSVEENIIGSPLSETVDASSLASLDPKRFVLETTGGMNEMTTEYDPLATKQGFTFYTTKKRRHGRGPSNNPPHRRS
jgi:hypothetical protein